MIYFDYTATTPVSEVALDAYVQTSLKITGNPSSEHPMGLEAKKCLEEARSRVAAVLKTDSKNITFTSGGSESDSIIIQSLLNNQTPGEIIVSGIEHSAVLENKRILTSKGWKFKEIRCPDGDIDLNELEANLTDKTRMVCIMKVNNVTGSILSTEKAVSIIRRFEKTISRKIHIHCDAVQALGKIPFYPALEDIDSAAFSAHKINGPRGIGILYNSNRNILPLSKAGGQENGLRGGTENLPAICSMVKAMEDSTSNIDSNYNKVLKLRKVIEDEMISNNIRILSPVTGSKIRFSPYIITISVKPIPSQVFLRMMSDKGFCLSAGSACSANTRGKAESVLSMMNFKPEERMSSIRISLSKDTTEEEVQLLLGAIKETMNGK